MKAITCTQCGAIIEDVSERSVIIHCNYCGARLRVDPIATPAYAPIEEMPQFYEEQPSTSFSTLKIAAFVVAGSVLIPLLIGVFALKEPKNDYVSYVSNTNQYELSPV